MAVLHSRFPETETWKRSLAVSIGVAVLYSTAVFGYSLLPFSNVSIPGMLGETLVISTALGFVTVGIPVFLWLRYNFLSPATLLVVILIFWHILVYIPPIGTGQGDSPGFLFVFAWAPVYLVAYVILSAVEYWFRQGNETVS